MKMLDELLKVDWSQYQNADSPSLPDIPSVMRALVSPYEDERNGAAFELYDRVFQNHPRTLPHLIPFLIELMEQSSVENRPTILKMLASLAGQSKQLENRARLNHSLSEAILRAFRCGMRLYSDYIADPSPGVREAAADALGATRDLSVIPRLISQLNREDEIAVRRATLAALGNLDARESIGQLLPFLGSEDLGERVQAAATLIRLNGQSIRDRALPILINAAIDPKATASIILPALSGIHAAGQAGIGEAVRQWIEKVKTVPEEQITEHVRRLVFLVFSYNSSGTRSSLEGLNDIQRRVLEELILSPRIWNRLEQDQHKAVEVHGAYGENFHPFYSFGLPTTKDELLEKLNH